ncbi:hypothetical protein RI054_03g18080 [Pseudoscourfieldia marina]
MSVASASGSALKTPLSSSAKASNATAERKLASAGRQSAVAIKGARAPPPAPPLTREMKPATVPNYAMMFASAPKVMQQQQQQQQPSKEAKESSPTAAAKESPPTAAEPPANKDKAHSSEPDAAADNKSAELDDIDPETPCEVCRSEEAHHPKKGAMLICDHKDANGKHDCNKGYHQRCLFPPVTVIPEGDWICPKCQRKDQRAKMMAAPTKPTSAAGSSKGASALAAVPPPPALPEPEVLPEKKQEWRCFSCGSKHDCDSMVRCNLCQSNNSVLHYYCEHPPLLGTRKQTYYCLGCRAYIAAQPVADGEEKPLITEAGEKEPPKKTASREPTIIPDLTGVAVAAATAKPAAKTFTQQPPAKKTPPTTTSGRVAEQRALNEMRRPSFFDPPDATNAPAQRRGGGAASKAADNDDADNDDEPPPPAVTAAPVAQMPTAIDDLLQVIPSGRDAARLRHPHHSGGLANETSLHLRNGQTVPRLRRGFHMPFRLLPREADDELVSRAVVSDAAASAMVAPTPASQATTSRRREVTFSDDTAVDAPNVNRMPLISADDPRCFPNVSDRRVALDVVPNPSLWHGSVSMLLGNTPLNATAEATMPSVVDPQNTKACLHNAVNDVVQTISTCDPNAHPHSEMWRCVPTERLEHSKQLKDQRSGNSLDLFSGDMPPEILGDPRHSACLLAIPTSTERESSVPPEDFEAAAAAADRGDASRALELLSGGSLSNFARLWLVLHLRRSCLQIRASGGQFDHQSQIYKSTQSTIYFVPSRPLPPSIDAAKAKDCGIGLSDELPPHPFFWIMIEQDDWVNPISWYAHGYRWWEVAKAGKTREDPDIMVDDSKPDQRCMPQPPGHVRKASKKWKRQAMAAVQARTPVIGLLKDASTPKAEMWYDGGLLQPFEEMKCPTCGNMDLSLNRPTGEYRHTHQEKPKQCGKCDLATKVRDAENLMKETQKGIEMRSGGVDKLSPLARTLEADEMRRVQQQMNRDVAAGAGAGAGGRRNHDYLPSHLFEDVVEPTTATEHNRASGGVGGLTFPKAGGFVPLPMPPPPSHLVAAAGAGAAAAGGGGGGGGGGVKRPPPPPSHLRSEVDAVEQPAAKRMKAASSAPVVEQPPTSIMWDDAAGNGGGGGGITTEGAEGQLRALVALAPSRTISVSGASIPSRITWKLPSSADVSQSSAILHSDDRILLSRLGNVATHPVSINVVGFCSKDSELTQCYGLFRTSHVPFVIASPSEDLKNLQGYLRSGNGNVAVCEVKSHHTDKILLEYLGQKGAGRSAKVYLYALGSRTKRAIADGSNRESAAVAASIALDSREHGGHALIGLCERRHLPIA